MSINYGYQKMFDTRKGLECLPETEAAPKKERLFGEFFYKNELAVLCGPEGSGRSILAMQIADSISRGVPLGEFGLDPGARPVVFLDIEGNHDEFARRYSLDGKQPYPFHDNFNIVRFHQNFRGYTSMRKDFLKELNTTVARHKDGVLIINNLDYWKCFMPEAYALAAIKELQANSRLSVLLISSLKGSPARKQLTPNRAGKLVTTMTDSIFAMNFSQKDADTRYLMQLKTKGGKPVYHPNHVAEFSLGKQHNFTGCQFTGFGTEQEHIAMPPTDFEMKIIELSLNKPELRLAEIADQLKTNKKRVDRVLKKFDAKEVRRTGALGGVVTSTFKNENSNTEILNSKSALDEATTDEEDSSSPCPLLLPATPAQGGKPNAGPETLEGLVTSTFINKNSNTEILNSKSALDEATTDEEDSSSPCPLLLPATPAQGGKPNAEPETLGRVVTSTFKNENSNTEILNSKSAFAEATADEEDSSSPCPLLSPTDPAQGGKPNAGSETVDTLVTSTFINENSNTEILNSKSAFAEATADEENGSSPNPLLSPTTPAQGGQPNAEPETHITTKIDVPTPIPTDPLRGELSNHTSKSGVAKTPTPLVFDPLRWKYKPSDRPSPPAVNQSPEERAEALKTLDALISSYCTSKPPTQPPNADDEPKLTYSQQVKKRIAEARRKKK